MIEVDLDLTLSLDSDFLKSFFCGQINQLPPCMALKTPWNRLYKVSVKQSKSIVVHVDIAWTLIVLVVRPVIGSQGSQAI